MRILYTGGGSLGSVTPLLAVHESLASSQKKSYSAAWIGTCSGPERALINEYHIPFDTVPTAKLRRYFDLRNFLDPFILIGGVFRAFFLLKRIRPDVVLSAGGFVAVPVIWAAWLLGIKSMLLQIDIKHGLANILTVQQASTVAVSFEELKAFYGTKGVVTGIPVRAALDQWRGISNTQQQAMKKRLGLPAKIPTVLIVGGGQGATGINDLVATMRPSLKEKVHIIHITGTGKGEEKREEGYWAFPQLGAEYLEYLATADIVVTRAGMGSLAECATLGKPMIIIPIPDSHQVYNAEYFEKKKAAIFFAQAKGAEMLGREILRFIKDESGAKMGTKASTLIDGAGAARCAAQIISLCATKK